MNTMRVFNTSAGTLIGDHIECADQSLTRLIGLLGRTDLPAGEGLWITPSSGIHTVGMRFTIDAVGLDRELRVVKLWRYLRPHRISSVSHRVRSVLELPAGTIEHLSIELGNQLECTQSFSVDSVQGF